MKELLKFNKNGQWTLHKTLDGPMPEKIKNKVTQPKKDEPKTLKPQLIVKDTKFEKPIHHFSLDNGGDYSSIQPKPKQPHSTWEQHPELGALCYHNDGFGNKSNISNSYTVHLNDDKQTCIAHISVDHDAHGLGMEVGGSPTSEEYDDLFGDACDAAEAHHKQLGRPFPSEELRELKAQLFHDKYFHPYNKETGQYDPPAAEQKKKDFNEKPFKDFDKEEENTDGPDKAASSVEKKLEKEFQHPSAKEVSVDYYSDTDKDPDYRGTTHFHIITDPNHPKADEYNLREKLENHGEIVNESHEDNQPKLPKHYVYSQFIVKRHKK